MNIVNPLKSLHLTMQHQLTPTWCWAAVGTSCSALYQPALGWTQCKLASCSLEPAPGNCCLFPAPLKCFALWYLESEDHTQGSFVTTGIANGWQDDSITFQDVVAQIKADLLITFGIELLGGFLHFAVICGYDDRNGKQMVEVRDSFFGNAYMPYDQFTLHYKFIGKVKYTFFTKKTNLHNPCP
jgi:hypothetical protein